MTYIDFLKNIKLLIKNTTVAGVVAYWQGDICLEDEIELHTPINGLEDSGYPNYFIVPLPFDIMDNHMTAYSCKIYMVDSVTRSPNYDPLGFGISNRFIVYDRMVNYAQAFIDQLPANYIISYPITINPIVKWDANIDGIWFEITIPFPATVCI